MVSRSKLSIPQLVMFAVSSDFQPGQIITRQQIIESSKRHFSKTSNFDDLHPSDYCIDHKNGDKRSGIFHLFSYHGYNKYEVLSHKTGFEPLPLSAWTRDELILVLELYFRISPRDLSENHPEISPLCELLNQLPTHQVFKGCEKFRDANSVYEKLCNFHRFDPDYTTEEQTGLSADSKLEKEVWDYFSNNRELLKEISSLIRSSYDQVGPAPAVPEPESIEFPEGGIVERVHIFRERNPVLIQKKKAWGIKHLGKLVCEVCGFDFSGHYGELGQNYIECHHKNPLADNTDISMTKLDDLAFVCSNCHRMLHRARPWLSIEELKKRLR